MAKDDNTKAAVRKETPTAEVSDGGARLVVCAYEGTDIQLSKVWERMTGTRPVVITVGQDDDIRDILAGVIADNSVADEFVLVPANCVP